MVGVDDARHRGPAGGHAAERPRLGGVRMGHVEIAPAEQIAQCMECPQITTWVDRSTQGWLDDHLQACGGRLVEQVIPATGDDRGPEVIRVKCLRAAQREHSSAALQPGDEGSHPQWPDIHRAAHPAEAAEISRDQ